MIHFVHLRLHSEYSIVDGIVRIDAAVKQAAADGMPALAITDLGNLFGAVKFFQAARAQGVQPIIGCDVWLSNDKNRDAPFRVLLLCRNQTGYHNLCVLLSRAYIENTHRGRAELRREWLAADAADGLIALSGADGGDIGQALLNGKHKAALTLAHAWQRDFPDAFYVEVQRPEGKGKKHESYIHAAIALAAEAHLPVVATHPVQFVARDDFKAHEARVCISEGMILGDARRKRDFSPEQYFKSRAEMAELFSDLPEALENTVEIAKRCHFEFSLGKSRLPDFPTPNGESIEDYLRAASLAGLEERLLALYPDAAKRDAVRGKYLERLEFEVRTIIQMGFPGYFLIVADFIQWAKHNGVPVGPGRGSGAGSLVAYSLKITDLDPLEYDLLFERFLNPERVSMPDFDIDFCQDGRDRVIDYVKNKYGRDSVSQIATFGTMAAKAVIRDVGRVLGMGYNYVDSIAKMIPNELGITLEKSIKQEPQFSEKMKAEEEVAELMALALKLEGITRNVGMHAGGVLIAPGPLTDFTPLYMADGSDAAVSQYDKDDVEAVGLVKFDFLGLTTLTIVAEAVELIRARGYGEPQPGFDLNAIPLDDKRAYRIFSAGNTGAIFQFESRGMRDLIMRAKPGSVDDLTALNALYRPGPMDLIPDYLKRKTGQEKVTFLDPRIEPILSPTCGIMVYQEQVMQIAQVIGGYSLGGADLLRRAMGKKKPEEMARHRSIFSAGAQKNGVSAKVASELYDFMEKFAGYGFNKSHSAAYSLVAYHTAYLKAHFPSEFMAANLSGVMDFTDKVQLLFDDTKANGLVILPPDINSGTHRFKPIDEKTIRYGLGAVKGTGQSAIGNIEATREQGGPFRDLLDFTRRVDRRIVNRRAMEALIKAGAFDSIDVHRASLLASLGNAIELADHTERNASQVSLFGEAEAGAADAMTLVRAHEWSERERLINEKQALGFYLSGHPFNGYAAEVRQFARTPLKDIQPKQETVLLAGILYEQRVRNSRRGRMAVLSLDDGTARVEVVVYSELFNEKRAIIADDHLLVVEGKVSNDEFSGGMRVVADNILDLDQARTRYARRLELSINGQADAVRLKEILSSYQPGACPVLIHYRNDAAEVDIALPPAQSVKLSDSLIESLQGWLTAANVAVRYDVAEALSKSGASRMR